MTDHRATRRPPARLVLSLDPPRVTRRTSEQASGPETVGPPPSTTRVRLQWTARLATPDDAQQLHVPVGAVVLHVVRTLSDATGAVTTVTTTLCPAERTVLHHSYPIPAHE